MESKIDLAICREDSKILAFCMVPAASGRGLCDIDRVLRLYHVSRNWEVLTWRKYINNLAFSILIIIGIRGVWTIPYGEMAQKVIKWDGSLFEPSRFLWLKKWAISEKRHLIEILSHFETEPSRFLIHMTSRGTCLIRWLFEPSHYTSRKLAVPGSPNFLTRDITKLIISYHITLVTLNNTLSISHSPRPLAIGPIRKFRKLTYA